MRASDRITREVGSWDGVTSRSHRFGGVEFRLGRVELGHIHGDSLADLPFPKKTRYSLIASGRAEPHHVLPDTGWLTRRMRSESDVDDVIRLFRLNYERISKRRAGAVNRPFRRGGSKACLTRRSRRLPPRRMSG
ncbi:MAG: DUF5519 family protein [Actinobacteria bacterium]|nr:DUF5519 family protein [Actinomycetota bacterium]